MYFLQTMWLRCIQEQNEVIFVPSGWYHQVHNLVSFSSNYLPLYQVLSSLLRSQICIFLYMLTYPK